MPALRCIVLCLFCISCGASVTGNGRTEITPGKWLRNVKVVYTAGGNPARGIVQVYFPVRYSPGKPARTLIVLHGYRQQPSDWENNTPLTEYADRYTIVLICPAMSTTLYESKYYPETTNRWAPAPGGEYIMKILIPYVRKHFGIATDRKRTGVFGISTGGRGALLLASHHPGEFVAAAGISGDYDPVSMRRDRLLVSVYGQYDSDRERWETEDNIMRLAKRLKKTAVFLAHGGRDAVVPPSQTEALASLLARLGADEKGGFDCVVERMKSRDAGHDWSYWAMLVPDVMEFFDRRLER